MTVNNQQLKDFIIDSGLVPRTELENAEKRAVEKKMYLGDILVSEGKLSEDDLSRTEAYILGIPFVNLKGQKIDFEIRVNLRAKPGIYHAIVSFAEGPTRDAAEGRLSSAPSATVNLEVSEDIKERLQLKKFIPDKIFFSGSSAAFFYELENIGNQTLAPSGEIRIYNRRGEEITAIDANQDNAALDPNTTKQFASVWQNANGFGQYKALINLEYGAKNAAIYDTVSFWLIPWQKILIIFGIFALIITLITYFLHQKYERRRTPQISSGRARNPADIKRNDAENKL